MQPSLGAGRWMDISTLDRLLDMLGSTRTLKIPIFPNRVDAKHGGRGGQTFDSPSCGLAVWTLSDVTLQEEACLGPPGWELSQEAFICISRIEQCFKTLSNRERAWSRASPWRCTWWPRAPHAPQTASPFPPSSVAQLGPNQESAMAKPPRGTGEWFTPLGVAGRCLALSI